MPETPDPQALTPSASRVLQHAELLGIATTRSVARTSFGGDHAQAMHVLGSLVDLGRLHRHRMTGVGPSSYFSPSSHSYRPGELASRIAVLEFAYCLRHRRPLLDTAVFDDVVGDVARARGLPTPKWRPCHVVQNRATQPSQLSVLRVARSDRLQRAIMDVHQFVESPAFAPFHPFAQAGQCAVTYLLPATREAVDELGRWFRRCPPVSRRSAGGYEVPVYVFQARSSRAA